MNSTDTGAFGGVNKGIQKRVFQCNGYTAHSQILGWKHKELVSGSDRGSFQRDELRRGYCREKQD
jgi:hypothetical protein